MSAKVIKGDDLVFALGTDNRGTFTKGGLTKRELFALAFAITGNYTTIDMESAWRKADAFIAAGNGGEVERAETKNESYQIQT